MKTYTEFAQDFLTLQSRKYGRSIQSYTKSYIRMFAHYLEEKIGNPGNGISSTVVPVNMNVNKIGARKVALITEEIGRMTGGRYYAWFIGIALVKLGFDVTIYTNQIPSYIDYFKDYKIPKLEIIAPKENLGRLDVQADIYISSPLLGNIAVTKLAEKYKKPCYVMIFDPIPMMDKFTGKPYSGWEESVIRISKSNVNLLTLCEATMPYTYDWLKKTKEQVVPVYPCINSVELDKAKIGEREDYVVFISRLVNHKKFDEVLEAVRKVGVRLKVISSVNGPKQIQQVRELKMQDRVEFHIAIDDVSKFEMINKSLAVINASNFEGFGMWAAEAVATGTPLVAYDLPSIVEIRDYTKVDNFYLAKFRDTEDLTNKLKQAIRERKFYKRNRIFDFESMVKRLKQLLIPDIKIGVVTIALNEEQYIGASLRSIIKNEYIKKVAVVEGAVSLYPSCNDKGLSIDNTDKEIEKVMNEENGNKIVYERFGFAKDKAELRNRALSKLKDMDYILVVDADEVWETIALNELIEGILQHPDAGTYRFNFYHFWKKPDLIARGSNWESMMFRCFNFKNKTLHWKDHEKSVVDSEEKSIEELQGVVNLKNVIVHHYGYMKDEKNIKDKLEYYKKRDTNLTVIDTWTDWKEGMPTSTTHGNGIAIKFVGQHPIEVLHIINK